jgi:hypothetical protein
MANKTGTLDKNNFQLNGAKLRTIVDTIVKATTDGDASVFYLGDPLPSNAVIHNIVLENDALTGATDIDIGFYDTVSNGAAVISKDCLLDGVSIASASTGFGTNAFTKPAIENKHKQIWELAGLSADPKKLMQAALTFNTAGSATGDIRIVIQYSIL